MAATMTRARRPGARSKRGAYAKSQATRKKILAAALKVAGGAGLHRTSVAAIADQAGVAIGNLHYHFGSRAELLHELMRWQVAELLETVRKAIDAHGDFFAKDEAAFRAYLEYVRRHPACVRLAEEVRLHHPKLYDATNAMWLAMFREALRDGAGRGELRPLGDDEIGVLAHLLMGARYFVDQMLQTDGAPSDELMVATYVRLTRGGLRKQHPGGRS